MFEFLKSKTINSNVETKSVQNSLTGSVSSIYSDFVGTVRLPSDSVTILNYNKGYANACQKIISQAIADLPYYLYRINNSSKKYIGKSIKVKDNELLRRAKKSLISGEYTLEKVFDHPFLNIMQSMEQSVTEFFYLISAYLICIGNCYILKVKDTRGNLVSLKILMSEYMSVKYDVNYNITEYQYQPLLGAARMTVYKPEDIIHLRRLVPGSMIVGRGMLEEALLSVSVSEETKRYLNCLLINNMSPKQMIVVKNNVKTETEAETIRDRFIELFSGYNRGKSIVTFGEVDLKDVTQNMGDNKMIETNLYIKKEICGLYGVPVDMLDSTQTNRATAIVSKSNFIRNTVFPLANTILDQLNHQLISQEYDDTFALQFDTQESLESDQLEQAQLFKMYLDMGVMTPDEIKEKLGL